MRRLASCIAAALLIASAGAAFGEDTINGKPLSDVHDIIREVNGGELAIVRKASILKLTQVRVDGKDDLHGSLFYMPLDTGITDEDPYGNTYSNHNDRTEKKDVVELTGLEDGHHFMGIMAAAGTKRFKGAERRVVVGDLSYYGNDTGGIKTFLTQPTDDGSIKLFGSVRTLPAPLSYGGEYCVFTDMRGGLFIDGERDESFVAGFMNDKGRAYTFTGGDVGGEEARVGFMILDGRKLNLESFTGDPSAHVREVAAYSDAQFPVLRIAAGDFDGDGKASEIALIMTPKEESYELRIYKVKRGDRGKVELEESLRQALGNIDLGVLNGNQRDVEAGCDIVAGDFDGDGLTEIAAVMISGKGLQLKPLVMTFKYVDGKYEQSDEHIFSDDFPDLCNTWAPGMLAVVGDLDGNGADDVAIAVAETKHYLGGSHETLLHIAAATFDPVPGGPPTPVLKKHIPVVRIISRKYTPLAKILSLAAGSTYAYPGSGGIIDELYFMSYGEDFKYTLYRLKDPLGFDSLWQFDTTDAGTEAAALLISDLKGESMLLGDPDHFITQDARSYYNVIPAVPYHIDYIRSDWRDPKAVPEPRALQLITPVTNEVTYTREESTSTKDDTWFEPTWHLEWGESLDMKLSSPVKDKGLFKAIGLGLGMSQAYKGSWEQISKGLTSNTRYLSSLVKTTVNNCDIANYYIGTVHIWRYPIIGTLADFDDADGKRLTTMMFKDKNSGGDVPSNDQLESCPVDNSLQKYYTVMHITDVRDRSNVGTVGDRYQADYDERNLFSYPNDLKYSRSYETMQIPLSDVYDIPSDLSKTVEIKFDQIGSGTKSEVSTWNNGGSLKVNGSLAAPPGETKVFTADAGFNVMGNYTSSNGSTFASTKDASTKYAVTINKDPNPMDARFGMENVAYVDAGGLTTLGFAVDLCPDSTPAHAWASSGPYGTSPDPSLVLPGRVSVGSKKEFGSFVSVAVAETRLDPATRLRGVRLYDRTAHEDPANGTSYTVSELIRGRRYTIVVPVYNASFVDTGPFEVQFGYTESERITDTAKRVPASDDEHIEPLGKVTMSLDGWKIHSDAHRGAVSFDWRVPLDMDRGAYALCVRIVGRPGDIHRDWNVVEGSSEYDPCGNDWGFYSFSVIDETDINKDLKPEYYEGALKDAASKSKAAASAGKPAASTSKPNIELTFKVEGQPPMTFEEFRRWLLGRTDPVDVAVAVTNTGGALVRGAYVVIYELLEDGRMRTWLDRDLTSLFPGKTISRHFTIDPQKFLTRDLRAEITGSNVSQTFGEPAEGSSSSSGCAAGAASIAAIALLAAAARRKRS